VIMVLGATGTIGSEVVRQALLRGRDVLAVGRNEEKLACQSVRQPGAAWVHADLTHEGDRLDAWDKLGIISQCEGVVNCAAMKHVGYCEANERAAIRINYRAAQWFAVQAAESNVKYVYVSTDKAVNPTSALGRTKRSGEAATLATPMGQVVRFGNILGSSGSVLPLWHEQMAREGRLKITDMKMMRYWIDVQNAAVFILDVLDGRLNSPIRIHVPENLMVRMRVIDVMRIAFGPDVPFDVVAPKAGEKIDEELYTDAERAALKAAGGP